MHRIHHLSGSVLLGVIVFATSLPPNPTLPTEMRVSHSPTVSVRSATSEQAERLASVTVRFGTSAQRHRLELALARFRDAGLELPDLEVVFGVTVASCKGHQGLFQTGFTPWRVTICSDAGFVYEHELAHAWDAATLTDQQREEFMELRGYRVWSDHDRPWNQRGMEGVALIIQQGLSGLPLPPALSDELLSLLNAFQFLTGFPDPRLAIWEAGNAQRSVLQHESDESIS